MKLIKFNALTAKSLRTGVAYVRFNKSGAITISPEAVRRMGLTEGDPVSIGQDPDNPDDWYVYHDKDGFATRCAKNINGLTFNSSVIFKSICTAFSLVGNPTSISCPVANEFTPSEDPELKKTKLWGLITGRMEVKVAKEEVADE